MEHIFSVSSDCLKSLIVPEKYKGLFIDWAVTLDVLFETKYEGFEVKVQENSIRLFYDERGEFFEFDLFVLDMNDFCLLLQKCNEYVDAHITDICDGHIWALSNSGHDDRGEWE